MNSQENREKAIKVLVRYIKGYQMNVGLTKKLDF